MVEGSSFNLVNDSAILGINSPMKNIKGPLLCSLQKLNRKIGYSNNGLGRNKMVSWRWGKSSILA